MPDRMLEIRVPGVGCFRAAGDHDTIDARLQHGEQVVVTEGQMGERVLKLGAGTPYGLVFAEGPIEGRIRSTDGAGSGGP